VKNPYLVALSALWLSAVMALPAYAQQKPVAPLVTLEVDVVLTRYDGTKKISSLPYTLAVNANGPEVALNMGTEVAVPTTTFTPQPPDGGKANPLVSYNYRRVGTQIEALATTTDDGRFSLRLGIDDSSV
jgi:hypothetical protein